ncbi:hypothetical protein X801_07344, partial [Opisthorchis viverrini]
LNEIDPEYDEVGYDDSKEELDEDVSEDVRGGKRMLKKIREKLRNLKISASVTKKRRKRKDSTESELSEGAFGLPSLRITFLDLCMSVNTVLCCRLTPLQKASIIKLVQIGLGESKRGAGPVTAAVGDGGNDVSMILQANVGIGIYGQEGREATRAADYALPQFRNANLRLSHLILFVLDGVWHGLVVFYSVYLFLAGGGQFAEAVYFDSTPHGNHFDIGLCGGSSMVYIIVSVNLRVLFMSRDINWPVVGGYIFTLLLNLLLIMVVQLHEDGEIIDGIPCHLASEVG